MQENSNSKSVRSPFLTRTLTGILFVAVMVGGILYSPFTCALLFLLITVLSVWEFTGLVNTSDDVQVNRLITTLAAVCLYLGIWGYEARINSAVPLFAPWLLSMIYLMIAELYLQRERPLNNWAYAMWAQIYVALPFSLTALLATSADRLIIVLCIFVFLWCSDTGAYCCGSLFGRHKLFLRVSPGKTWEGSIGGGVLTLAASQLVAVYVPVLTFLQWAGFALVVVIFGTWGDLVESLFKRQLGVKDSGHILPGHGGMLDRFDSSLLAIPACIVYLYALSVL
ncbi:MAG: phosphatidate cytidylyltransferase [Bacteroidaceae bacterium]|nr:phosphatidate cytidylyltransferase [Bacteroidaceae bacterium]